MDTITLNTLNRGVRAAVMAAFVTHEHAHGADGLQPSVQRVTARDQSRLRTFIAYLQGYLGADLDAESKAAIDLLLGTYLKELTR